VTLREHLHDSFLASHVKLRFCKAFAVLALLGGDE
jgi:hypothetical protein